VSVKDGQHEGGAQRHSLLTVQASSKQAAAGCEQ
jgi:hypothetical protein